MKQFKEKRDSMRLEVDCEVLLRSLNSDEFHKASCVTLSGSGISLVCEHQFPEKKELEVKILPSSNLMQPMIFYIQIVHLSLQNNGLYTYGAAILMDKDHE